MSEHQKRQEARRKDYEMIEVTYRHLKQAIVGDETLEQTKAALEEFKTNEELKAAGLRFNPALKRWLNVARDRIIRWERDNPPEPEPKPKTEPKPKGDKEPEKKPDKEPETKSEKEPETVEEKPEEEPKDETEETPEEAAQPVGEETDTGEKVEEDPESKEPEVE